MQLHSASLSDRLTARHHISLLSQVRKAAKAQNLTSREHSRELANALDTSNWAFVKDVLDVLTNFMCSADMKFYSDHFTRFNGKPNLTTKMVQYQAEVVDAAERVWVRMCDPDDPFPTVHDCYLKLYSAFDARPQPSIQANTF
jgi:hypothetical protein